MNYLRMKSYFDLFKFWRNKATVKSDSDDAHKQRFSTIDEWLIYVLILVNETYSPLHYLINSLTSLIINYNTNNFQLSSNTSKFQKPLFPLVYSIIKSSQFTDQKNEKLNISLTIEYAGICKITCISLCRYYPICKSASNCLYCGLKSMKSIIEYHHFIFPSFTFRTNKK